MEVINIPIADLKDLFTYFQLITAIAGSLCYYKYKDTFLKYFLFLLWYIVFNDFFAKMYRLNISAYDVFFYNIFQIISFSFYLLLFKKAIKSPSHKKTISILLFAYYFCYFINLFVEDFFTSYFTNTFIIGGTMIIISILIYFFELLKSNKIIQINKMLLCWISIGLLFFILPNIPFNIAQKYDTDSPIISYNYTVYFSLLFIYNIILITGFFSSDKKQRDFI
jgi:uncharacterized membrane protein YfcA